MIVILHKSSTDTDKHALALFLQENNLAYKYIDATKTFVIPKFKQEEKIKVFKGIEKIISIDTPYQLASKLYKTNTVVEVKSSKIGDNNFTMIAGPCSVENEDQIFQVAEFLHNKGIKNIRGGAYKPRTSPYSFRGLEKTGLQLLHKAAKAYNLNVVTEVLDTSLIGEVAAYADIIQVGSRNMHNFYMLNELGKINKPIILKRGFQAKVVEWLLAAEYIMSGGNEKIILCERGIRSFDPSSRNILDINVIPLIKELSHLPIIVDPSHATGIAKYVTPASLAATAIGADGLLIEVHPKPAKALSDGDQALSFEEFDELLKQTQTILSAINKKSDLETFTFKLSR